MRRRVWNRKYYKPRRHPLIYADVRAFVGHYTKVTMNPVPSVLRKIVPDIDIE